MTIGQDLSDYMEGQFTEEEDKQIRNLTVEEVFKLLSTHLTKEYPDGTEVLYDTYPEGTDFYGIIVNNIIWATGVSKKEFKDMGVATYIEVERAENIRLVQRSDKDGGKTK